MRAARLIIGGCLAICLSQLAAAKSKSDCTLKAYASVQLVLPDDRTVLVPITVNAQPAFMVLDTANGGSQVTRSSVTALKLPFEAAHGELTYGNKPIAGWATVTDLFIGKVHFARSTFEVPEPSLKSDRSHDGRQIIGTLGMNLFGSVDVEIDLAHETMTFYSPDHCAGQVVYWASSYVVVPMEKTKWGNLHFPMELNGKKLDTTLTTTSANSMLLFDAYKALFAAGDDATLQVLIDRAAASGDASRVQGMSLTAEGLEVTNAHIVLANARGPDCKFQPSMRNGAGGYDTDCTSAFPLYLGVSVLKKLHVYIATKERKLYFTASTPDPVPAIPSTPESTPTPAAPTTP